jgi:hypothetical protein
MTRLLPCPFCGGKAEIKACRAAEDAMDTWVACERCGATTDRVEGAYSEPEQAAYIWNARRHDEGRGEVDSLIANSIAVVVQEVGGFWATCTGCHETEDGHDVGHYPFSRVFNCKLGGGCSECGGIGAVWDDTNYDDLAKLMIENDQPDVDAFLEEVRAELIRARAKFPGDRIMTIALAEEFGELCKAVLDEPAANVRKEAVQTAVMAARVVLDGDGSVNDWRAAKGLDPLVCPHPDCGCEFDAVCDQRITTLERSSTDV